MITNSVEIFSINKDALFFDNFKQHCKTDVIYNDLSEIQKAIRFFHLKYLPIQSQLWFNKAFKEAGGHRKTIIVFDSSLSVPAANYLKRKFPHLRIIYWFWNHINDESILLKLIPGIERWSYDPLDCEKYDLHFNSQFYFDDFILLNNSSNQELYDFCFVGKEKGRTEALLACESLFQKLNLSYKFVIIGNSHKDRLRNWLPYNEIVSIINKSRCILDLVPEEQHGLTLRPLEALFHKKKLLTNFRDIKDYDFYSENNIASLNNITDERIIQLLSNPYKEIDYSIKNYYLFENWVYRFGIH